MSMSSEMFIIQIWKEKLNNQNQKSSDCLLLKMK